jgi:hypothetical protein
MTILIRTPLGNDALRSPDAQIPRRSQSLLSAIDGKTDSSLYIATLSAFGDVASLLETLLRAGLVRAVEPTQPNGPIATRPAASRAMPNQISTWFLTTVQHAGDALIWSDTFSLPHQPSDDSSLDIPGKSPFAAAESGVSGVDRDSTAQQQVRKAVLLMSEFVATHFSKRAAELLPVIDKLTSVERIARSLKDYEALVAPAGKAATQHLADLRATLTRL